jgi:dihydroorotate dehydrogenase (NAD+) catalytic subunit
VEQTSPLEVDLAGLRLRNPVMLAAGTAGYVDEMAGAMDLSRLGGLVTKSITGDAREGNPTWRILECRTGMLNAIGLANVGAAGFEREHAPRVAGCPCAVVGSIAGASLEEYQAVGRVFAGIDAMPAVEVNVSCPNVHSGTQFGDDPDALRDLVVALRETLASKRLFVKLPPVTTGAPGVDIVGLATASLDAGADGLTIANTTPAMAIDVETREPRLANVTGGLSGPAVHPVVVRLIHVVHRAVAKERGAPIIGAGGVTTWEDAAEMILAGATAVQVGAATFADPRIPAKIARGLEKWVRRQGAGSISELVGAVRLDGGAA